MLSTNVFGFIAGTRAGRLELVQQSYESWQAEVPKS